MQAIDNVSVQRQYDDEDSILRGQWGKRRFLRSNSITSDYAREAGTPLPSKSRKNGVVRSFARWLSRTRKSKVAKTNVVTRPVSPASAPLSRTSSASSSREAMEQRKPSRPRVSFDVTVTTVVIEQMDAEEVSKTFYCRTEYAAFKDAYRTHRDTRDWCRSNDVLPCNCDSCQDDLVEGGHVVRSSPWTAAEEQPAHDSSISTERISPGTDHVTQFDVALQGDDGEGMSGIDVSTECTAEAEEKEEVPPSPVGAVFEGGDEDEVDETGDGNDGADGNEEGETWGLRGGGCPVRRNTWNNGTVCGGASSGGTHKRGMSWDGGSTSVQQAVEKHGVEYAYKTLRLQGFSDVYIRTHFLPEGSPPRGGSMR